MNKNFWHADTYSQFLDARTRPARDLVAAIPDVCNPQVIYDLGCGPGNSTALLTQRWPEAKVIGVDSSDDMLDKARATHSDIEFIKGDIAHFAPTEKADIIFSNAALQWVDDHPQVFAHLIKQLNPNGILAVQMPNNFHNPSHQVTIDILQNVSDWTPLLKNLRYGKLNQPMYQLADYYDLLNHNGLTQIQLWETTYYQEMADAKAIFDWTKSTGLAPVLAAMSSDEKSHFEAQYIDKIAKSYPKQTNGKLLFPFQRIFMAGMT